MAMIRRPRQGGGRHPPPLAPTVSNFKPRAQWSNSGSSIFLYVNLPGFYRDQIEIKKDERTRTIQIQGQRPLSTQTKARFNEAYRVPESCDMTKLNTSFSHGLLTIEFPAVVEADKPEKAVQDQGKTGQSPNQDESKGPGLNRNRLGRTKPSGQEKQMGTSQEKAAPMANQEQPKTYKSVVEGKRAVLPVGSSQEKSEKKGKVGEASPSLDRNERAKEEKVVERKEADQQKIKKEEEARLRPMDDGSSEAKVLAKEEKVIARKKDGGIGQKMTGQKVKEERLSRTPTIRGGSLRPKAHAKGEEVVERNGDGKIGQKLKEERKVSLETKKEEKHTKPAVGDEARRREKEIDELKAIVNVKSQDVKNDEKMVGDKGSEGVIQESMKLKAVEEAGLVKETGDLKDKLEVAEPKRSDLSNSMKEESSQGGEDKEKMVEKSSESETGPLLVKGQKKTKMDAPVIRGRGKDEEESQKYDISLVNIGAAALVIMVFGAYVFVPLVKMFY